MEIGLSLLLAVPWAVYVGYLLEDFMFVVMIPLALLCGGYCCLRIGYDERVKLRDQEELTNKGD